VKAARKPRRRVAALPRPRPPAPSLAALSGDSGGVYRDGTPRRGVRVLPGPERMWTVRASQTICGAYTPRRAWEWTLRGGVGPWGLKGWSSDVNQAEARCHGGWCCAEATWCGPRADFLSSVRFSHEADRVGGIKPRTTHGEAFSLIPVGVVHRGEREEEVPHRHCMLVKLDFFCIRCAVCRVVHLRGYVSLSQFVP
jgi:hypothetical protein